MKMETLLIQSFGDKHLQELQLLYQSTWWANTRKLLDIRKLLEHTTVKLGLVDPETEKLIGFIRAVSDQVYKALIFDVIVHPDFQGFGLGKKLMHEMINHPLIRTVEHIELYCLDDKLGFYENLGFEPLNAKINFVRLNKVMDQNKI